MGGKRSFSQIRVEIFFNFIAFRAIVNCRWFKVAYFRALSRITKAVAVVLVCVRLT